MAWEIPITIDDEEYPVRFDGETEPTQQDIEAAVGLIQQQRNKPTDTGQGLASSMAFEGARAIPGIAKSIVGGTGALASMIPGMEDNFLQRGAQEIEDWYKAKLPVNPLLERGFPVKAASAVGQGVGLLGLTLGSAGLGATPAIAQRIGLGTAGLMGAEQGAETAEQYGMDDWQRRAAIAAGATIEAGTERLGGLGAPGFTKSIMGLATDASPALTRAAKTIASEALEEPAAGQANALVTQGLVQEDPSRPGFAVNGQPLPPPLVSMENLKERAEEAALGAVGGAVFAGAEAVLAPVNAATIADPDLPPEAKQAVAEAADMSLEGQAKALREAGIKAAQKATETQKTAPPAEEPTTPAAEAPAETAARTIQPLVFSAEEGDYLYTNGAWTTVDGQPVTDAAALDAARQAYIQTGDMPEGMQPYEAPVTPAPVTPPVTSEPAVTAPVTLPPAAVRAASATPPVPRVAPPVISEAPLPPPGRGAQAPETPTQEKAPQTPKEWALSLPNEGEIKRMPNVTDQPYEGEFKEGELLADHYGDDPYIYRAEFVSPESFRDVLKLEGMTYEQVVKMPTTQQYIEWYKEGKTPPPISVVIRQEDKRQFANNRRRVVAALEAGVTQIPAYVEIGKASELWNKPISTKPSEPQPTPIQTYANEIPSTESLPPRETPESSAPVREGDTEGREAPEARLQQEEVAPPAKEIKPRIGRKLTPEQATMRTRAFKTHPTVETDLISRTQGEYSLSLSPPVVVTVKDPQTGKKRLELGPGYQGMAEWDWYKPLLEDPAARAEVDAILFKGGEPQPVSGLDNAASQFGMTGDQYGQAMLAAAQERIRLAKDLTQGKGLTDEEQRMESAEDQRVEFEKATKQGKGKEPITTWDLNAGDVLDVDGTEVRVKEIDPDTGDATLEDGTRFGREITLETGDAIWVEKKGTPEAPRLPRMSAQEQADDSAPTPNPFLMRASRGEGNITPDMDDAYLAAVERGDMETAQRMVDEAAKKAGYNSGIVWHGTPNPNFTEFEFRRRPKFSQWEKTHEDVWVNPRVDAGAIRGKDGKWLAISWNGEQGKFNTVEEAIHAAEAAYPDTVITTRPAFFFAENKLYADKFSRHSGQGTEATLYEPGATLPFYLSLKRPLDFRTREGVEFLKEWIRNNLDYIGNTLEDWSPKSLLGAFKSGSWAFEALPKFIEDVKAAGYDGYYTIEGGTLGWIGQTDEEFSERAKKFFGRGGLDASLNYAVFSPSQIKSADPVTRDAQGNVIPLSQRFNPQSRDIRYSKQSRSKVLSRGITPNDVRTAADALARILPNARTAWVGTRKELEAFLRTNKPFAATWKRIWQTLMKGTAEQADAAYEEMITNGLNVVEAFTFQGRTFIITDQVQVTTEDGTPDAAARRVLIHEDAHEALEFLRAIDKDVEKQWQSLRNAIPANELDELASTRYRSLSDWRDNADSYDELAEEWFTKKISEIEERGRPSPNSLVGKFIQFLRDIVKRFTGKAPTDQALLDFVDAARVARFRTRAELDEKGIRYAKINSDGDQRVNSALGDVSDEPEQTETPLRTRFELMSDDQREQFQTYEAKLAGELQSPELSYFTQFLSNPTTNKRLRQALGPIIEYGRTFMGGIWGEAPAVNAENTERAWETVNEWLTDGRAFVTNYLKGFRDSGFATDGHQGDAAAAVLQMELMDYAVRLASETGDTRMMSLLYPYANDMVLSDYATMSGAARNLQVRSQAVREAGVWTALRLTYANLDKRAEEEIGKEDLDTLKTSVETAASPELKAEVEAAIKDKLDNSVNGKAIVEAIAAAETPEYDTEGYWNRVLRMFEGDERADLYAFWQTLTNLDRDLQLLEAVEGQKAASGMKFSLGEDIAKTISDPAQLEALKQRVEANKGKLLELLGKLTKSDTSSESKDKRRAITRNPKVKRALKALSTTQQAKAMLERFENRNKRLKRDKPAWKKTFEDQIKKPQTEEDFMAAVQKEGMTEQTSRKLFELAATLRTERANKPKPVKAPTPPKVEDPATKYEKEAQRLIESQSKQKEDPKAPSPLRVLQSDFLKGKITEQQFRNGMGALNVAPETQDTLVDVSEAIIAERQQGKESRSAAKEATKEDDKLKDVQDTYEKKVTGDYKEPVKGAGKAPNMADTRAFLSFIAEQITSAPITLQEDPAWKRMIVVNALKERGMSQTQAEDTATKLVNLIDRAIKEGQAKAAIKAMKNLKKAKKLDAKKIGEAIRTRGLDPLNPHPVVAAIAKELGYIALTPAQFKRLADLDQQANTEGPTRAGLAYSEIDKILSTVRPDKQWKDILASSWVYSALSSTGVAFLNWINPLFVSITSIGTQLASVSTDFVTGKLKATDALTMIGQSFGNWVNAMSYMGAEASFALKNDAYSNRVLEMLNNANRMHQDMMKALAKIKTGTPKEKVTNAIKFLMTSTDLVRRSMASADQMWGGVLQQFIIQNEAMRQLVTKAGLSAEQAAVILNGAAQTGQKAQQDHMAKTGDRAESVLVGKDALQSSLTDAMEKVLGREKAEEVGLMAGKEASMELGNRLSESGGPLDLVNGIFEMLKLISNSLLRKYGLNARLLTGFITVAANIINRSAYFSPVGIARAVYKMKSGRAQQEKLYSQTMATDGQARMRLIEGVAGTLALLLLMMLRKDSDDEEGFVMTGEGPPEPKDKEAWLKLGHKQAHFEWVGKDGRVLFSIPYARGGFDNLAFPMTFVGAMDDLQLQRRKLEKKNARAAWLYGETVIMNLTNQARFFGMKNLVSSVPTSLKEGSMAKAITYSAAPVIPWSGLMKSMSRLVTGQQDASSVNSAIMANLPLMPLVSGKPARNYLGDPVGPNAMDLIGRASERLHYAGIPIYVGIKADTRNGDIYKMLLEKGVSPSIPMRSTIESANGQITDGQWEKYLITRGNHIKDSLRADRYKIQFMEFSDAQEHIESLSRDATKATKKALGLR
jgi:hypothetical protein